MIYNKESVITDTNAINNTNNTYVHFSLRITDTIMIMIIIIITSFIGMI